ncbi:MAG: hypothetical protein IMZ65_03555 [Planctomycetes bacterium]|nr:hypothetical protein [Planctomycetota bacterium]
MTWQIDIPGAGRQFEVEPGRSVNIAPADGADPLCTAVATGGPDPELAIVFTAPYHVVLNGRPVRGPLLALDRRGGEVAISSCHGETTKISVKHVCTPATDDAGKRCPLCRGPLRGGSPQWYCHGCGAVFHEDCLGAEKHCQVCGAKR